MGEAISIAGIEGSTDRLTASTVNEELLSVSGFFWHPATNMRILKKIETE